MPVLLHCALAAWRFNTCLRLPEVCMGIATWQALPSLPADY